MHNYTMNKADDKGNVATLS